MAEDGSYSKAILVTLALLLTVLMVSALAVIYCKNFSRSLFSEIEKQERAIEQYGVEWGQMQLELSTLAEQNRVESIAQRKLKMIMPTKEHHIYIKP